MINFYRNYIDAFQNALESLEINDLDGNELDYDNGFEKLCELSEDIKKNNARQIFCGNGASSGIASHMAIDWSKNAKVPTLVLSDPAILTAVANDIGSEDIFSTPLGFYARQGDLLVTISSSGNSPNIISAIKKARELSVNVVTFSGLKQDNQSRRLGDLNLYIPAKTYGIVECAHQVLMHVWLDSYMGVTEWDRKVFQDMRQKSYQI